MRYGTIIADPPWDYCRVKAHKKLTGYSSMVYNPLTTDDLIKLPVGDLASDNAVLLLWTTWPFLPDALRCINAWGFKFITGLPWVKIDDIVQGKEITFKPTYGVGYWMRGCTEPILLAKRPNAPSVRQPYVGLLSKSGRHSRKPDTIYELAESFPEPRLELFARRAREGWRQLGNEAPENGADIRDSIPTEVLR